MQVNVKQVANGEYEVHVRVARSEYDAAYREAIGALRKKAKLPGFRPGRVPEAVLRKKFAQELHEDAAERIVHRRYLDALEKAGLHPAVQPQIVADEAADAEGFSFVMHVVVWPEVELADLSQIEIPCTQIVVDDEAVAELEQRLLRETKRFVPEPARKAALGDRVRVDLRSERDGKPVEDLSAEDLPIVLGKGEFVREIEEALIGTQAGDERSVLVKDRDGDEMRVFLLVREVARPEELKSAEELAEALGYEDVAAMRADLRERLEREAEAMNRKLRLSAAEEALLAQVSLQMPRPIVQEEMRALWRDLVLDARARGQELDPGLLRDPKVLEQLRARAERSLRLAAIVRKLVQELDVKVSDEELKKAAEALVDASNEEERTKHALQLLQNEELRDRLRSDIEYEKALEELLARGKLAERRVPMSQWEKERQAAPSKEDEQGEA